MKDLVFNPKPMVEAGQASTQSAAQWNASDQCTTVDQSALLCNAFHNNKVQTKGAMLSATEYNPPLALVAALSMVQRWNKAALSEAFFSTSESLFMSGWGSDLR